MFIGKWYETSNVILPVFWFLDQEAGNQSLYEVHPSLRTNKCFHGTKDETLFKISQGTTEQCNK